MPEKLKTFSTIVENNNNNITHESAIHISNNNHNEFRKSAAR